jgi:hypothetical protein
MAKSGNIKMSRAYEVVQPANEVAYPIAVVDWERLIERIERCSENSFSFSSVFWGLLGLSASGGLSALSLHASLSPVPWVPAVFCWCLCAIFGISAAICHFLSRSYQAQRAYQISMVVEHMRDMARRFQRNEPPLDV